MAGSNCSSLNVTQYRTLGWIYVGTATASLLGACSIVFSAILTRKFRSSEVLPLFHLSLADVFSAACALAGVSLYLEQSTDITTIYACTWSIGLVAGFSVCTYFLTLSYAIEVYQRLSNRFAGVQELASGEKSRIMCILYSLAWLLPLIFAVGITLISTFTIVPQLKHGDQECYGDICLPFFHYNTHYCLTQRNQTGFINGWHVAMRFTVLVPLVIVMFLLAVTYVLVLQKFKKATFARGILGPQQRKEETVIRRRAAMYIIAFGVCWIPSMVLGIISFTQNFCMEVEKYFPLFVVQAVTAPLQGFLNAIVYGWSRSRFKNEMFVISASAKSASPSPIGTSYEDERSPLTATNGPGGITTYNT